MILLSSPLKNDALETTVSIFSFLEIEIFITKIVNSKGLKKICRQLLWTMNVIKAGNPQGSSLAPILFLIYINDLRVLFSFEAKYVDNL